MNRVLFSIIILVVAAVPVHAQYYLRQSTASQEMLIGPFLDDTDGKTAKTGLTIANTDVKLWKRGATSEANKNSGGGTHVAAGRYYITLDDTDTNTLGELEINVVMSGALPVQKRCIVLPANVFDSFVLGSDTLDINVVDWKGSTAPAMTGDAYARLGAPAGASVSADVAAIKASVDTVDDFLDTEVAAILADTNELQTDWTNGGRLDLLLDLVLADTNELQTDWVNGGRLDLLLDATLADTNELQADWVNGGRLDLLIDAIKLVTDHLDTALELDGAVYRFTTNALEQGSSCSGSGGTSWTIQVNTTGAVPVADCRIWITTDSAGANTIAGPVYTDASGQATFMLDSGSYYAWRMKYGVTFTNPQTFTVP
jgi:hypothetical protein